MKFKLGLVKTSNKHLYYIVKAWLNFKNILTLLSSDFCQGFRYDRQGELRSAVHWLESRGMFCRFMKGFSLYGQAKEHYDIWTDDERALGRKSRQAVCRLSLTSLLPREGAMTVCFPAGTKVHTQWGLADIENLEIGVPVLTYNEETGRQEYKQVKKVMRRMTRRMCAMELSNGTTLEVTPEHRFFSNGEWVPIEVLDVNDTLQLKDNSIVVIENKIIFPTFVEVYNLEIEDNENYYVTIDGVLAHNGCEKDKVYDSEEEAICEAKKRIGLKESDELPESVGKFGSPQYGDAKKGFRIDPAHDGAAIENQPHVNY